MCPGWNENAATISVVSVMIPIIEIRVVVVVCLFFSFSVWIQLDCF